MDAQTDRCPGRCIEVQTDVQAEAQMDTQVDVQMDMQMDRQMDAQMGTQMDARTDTQMDTETCIGRHTDVQADMQTNTQMIYRCLCVHRWTHRWMRRHTERCPDGHMGVQVDAQSDRWTYGWTPRCTDGHAGGCFIPFLSLDLEFLGGGLMNPVTNTALPVRRALKCRLCAGGNAPGVLSFSHHVSRSVWVHAGRKHRGKATSPYAAPSPLSLNPIAITN